MGEKKIFLEPRMWPEVYRSDLEDVWQDWKTVHRHEQPRIKTQEGKADKEIQDEILCN